MGYLELILGSMYSGKTSKLVKLYEQITFCNNTVIVINHSSDNRYSETELETHDHKRVPCVFYSSIQEFIDSEDISLYEYILINEGQFFEDIELVRGLVDSGKHIYICGLDGDFKRNKIGNLLELIPYADNFYKLKSMCIKCRDGTKAVFSYRVSDEDRQVVIGSSNYIPLCRACYDSMN